MERFEGYLLRMRIVMCSSWKLPKAWHHMEQGHEVGVRCLDGLLEQSTALRFK